MNTNNFPLNRVIVGDCVEIMGDLLIPLKGEIDMIFADPPYNLSQKSKKIDTGNFRSHQADWDAMDAAEYSRFTKEWIHHAEVMLRPNGAIYVCASFHNLGEVLEAMKGGFKVRNIITWAKTNPMPSVRLTCFTHASEFIVYALKKGTADAHPATFNAHRLRAHNHDDGHKQMSDVWRLPQTPPSERLKKDDSERAEHPSQKPEEIVERCVIASTHTNYNPGPPDKPDGDSYDWFGGSIVLDPFFGTGTTGAVCKRCARNWIGIEKNKKFAKLAEERIKRVNHPFAALV